MSHAHDTLTQFHTRIGAYKYLITMEVRETNHKKKEKKMKIIINQLKENVDQNHDALEHDQCGVQYGRCLWAKPKPDRYVDERAFHRHFFLHATKAGGRALSMEEKKKKKTKKEREKTNFIQFLFLFFHHSLLRRHY